MKKISKTTINMARKRGIELTQCTVERNGADIEVVEISEWDAEAEEAADEYPASYRITDDGLFWDGACYGDSDEWPNWIESEAQLRSMLDAMAHEVRIAS